MPELLLELFSEEIPSRFQRSAAKTLKKLVTGALAGNGLSYESAAAFATPCRLALSVTGLPDRSPDTSEERKGPRLGAPERALEGFLRAAGLASIADARIKSDPKKGDYYVAVIEKPGAPATAILADILPRIITSFPWAKSMRWGSGRLNWVRPLRAITATFGTDSQDPQIIGFEVDGLRSGQTTFGHRFLGPGPISVKRFDDYKAALEKARVVLDLDRRMEIIKTDAEQLAFAQGLSVISDDGLLEEVAGLVEWPVVMTGAFDEAFLGLPEEVVIATIRTHQKCFCLRGTRTGKLANRFILTANTEAADGGAEIVAGNEKVIRARLSDARFFYETDLGTRLEDNAARLKQSVFHAKLGSQYERVLRLVELAGEIAPLVGAGQAKARRAALLAKADLVTGMVGEFPELQGLMGRYYALAQGEDPAVANAIEMHYKPLGPSDAVPAEPVAIAVALADKFDLLLGFWAIDQKPTGSRDPFALRRAALGVIRILMENAIDASPRAILVAHAGRMPADEPAIANLLGFIEERLAVSLKERGVGHDVLDAVRANGGLASGYSVIDLAARANDLAVLLGTATGKALLAGYRRAINIVVAEEKKDAAVYAGSVDTGALLGSEEKALAAAIDAAHGTASEKVTADDYKGAMQALSALQGPVDAFFEAVLVNDPDKDVRANRLNLLARLRDTMHLVADFSKIEG